ncbi:methyltransferase [Xylariaceae sp. FL0594]|nr:methyltransferase [Xylariaceae sp. FL0594]
MSKPNETTPGSETGAAVQQDGLHTAIYTPSFLSLVYNWVVLYFNLRWMWRCRADTVLEPFFSENFSRNHLDIGVATGYFPSVALSRPFRSHARQTLVLADLNPNPLRAAAARILSLSSPSSSRENEKSGDKSEGNISVSTVVADITLPPPPALASHAPFDSISMFNLFHCVPGGPAHKLQSLDQYAALLSEKGVLSGCSVLGGDAATNWVNYAYVKMYNRLGIFCNWDDNKEHFEDRLRDIFDEVEITVVGMIVLFRATRPKNKLKGGE